MYFHLVYNLYSVPYFVPFISKADIHLCQRLTSSTTSPQCSYVVHRTCLIQGEKIITRSGKTGGKKNWLIKQKDRQCERRSVVVKAEASECELMRKKVKNDPTWMAYLLRYGYCLYLSHSLCVWLLSSLSITYIIAQKSSLPFAVRDPLLSQKRVKFRSRPERRKNG